MLVGHRPDIARSCRDPTRRLGGSCRMTPTQLLSRLAQADGEISDRLNRQRDTWPMRVIGAVSDIGDQPQMRLICAATMTAGAIRRDGRPFRTGVKMLAAHTMATWGKSGVKAVIDRTRPDSGDDPAVRTGDSDDHEETAFPSGHSAGAIAVAQAFARSYPQHAMAARTAAMAVAAAQVPRGTHYVGDVLAGTLIGVAAEHFNDAVRAHLPREGSDTPRDDRGNRIGRLAPTG